MARRQVDPSGRAGDGNARQPGALALTPPEPGLQMAWCSGGDLMIYREDSPQKVTTTEAARLRSFYARRLESGLDFSQGARDYLRRWVNDLDLALEAQREWTLCSGPIWRAA